MSEEIFRRYQGVLQFIETFSHVLSRNPEATSFFRSIGKFEHPIRVRWGTLLRATNFINTYFDHILIFCDQNRSGIKSDSFKLLDIQSRNLDIKDNIKEISDCYGHLPDLIKRVEKRSFSIEEAYDMGSKIKFRNDPFNLMGYYTKKFNKNLISEICNNTITGVGNGQIDRLKKCPSTSVEVERSFSMVTKMMAKDRNFDMANFEAYVMIRYNKM
ncbi:hypothetical protein ECANGB1_1789 [Enterospora canceri]|uniref:Uncharacterized protein n=1 Tax=Enterospora canceri TaxID=1081671 RepID=A0A1Y1S5J0_9MICR|nr:hypothetical protein ECANGB1_1789 [Enterospora canceri]